MEIKVSEYLTWQRANPENKDLHPDSWQACSMDDWSYPRPTKNCLPQWFKDLPANMRNLNLPKDIEHKDIIHNHGYRSAKLCLGLRGIRTVGWTIPLTHNLTSPPLYPGHDGNVGRKEIMLHPAMLTGSGFDKKRNDGLYEWEIRILSFPWRAKMLPGWRMMITAHPLTWSPDWFCFSGCVDANYRHDGTNIGSFWNFPQAMDLDQNYYNVEVVIAVRSQPNHTITVESGTCMFSMIPIYDPDYRAQTFKEFPNFADSSHGSQ